MFQKIKSNNFDTGNTVTPGDTFPRNKELLESRSLDPLHLNIKWTRIRVHSSEASRM
jgi:hypothetical protein